MARKTWPLSPGKLWVWLFTAMLLQGSIAWSAQPYQPMYGDPLLEPWRRQDFPELNGRGVRCMAEGRDSTMWFGTDAGVVRYDGIQWTEFTPLDGLLGAPVNVLCVARDGGVLAGSDMGISRFADGVWSRVFPVEGELAWPVDGLMEALNGSIWAATAWGAVHLGPDGAVLYTTAQTATDLALVAPRLRFSVVPAPVLPVRRWREQAGLGVRLAEGGYIGMRRDSAPMTVKVLASGGPGEAARLEVGDRILEREQPFSSRTGRGSVDSLTVLRPGKKDPFEMVIPRGNVDTVHQDFQVYDVFQDRDGAIWFGLERGELVRFTMGKGEETWRLFTAADGLEVGTQPRIGQTRDGVIWAISNNSGRGVNRFDGERWKTFKLSEYGGRDINNALLETRDGEFWIAGYSTLHRLRDGGWQVYGPPEVLIPPTRIVQLLEASDRAVWIVGLGQGVVRWSAGQTRWTTYEGLSFQCETPDGSLWFISNDDGVVRFTGDQWVRYGSEDGLLDTPVALVVTEEGTVWAAGSHARIAATARFEGSRWTMWTHPRVSWGIDYRALYAAPDGAVWFGGTGEREQAGQTGGVLRFKGGEWVHFGQTEGVPENVYGIGQTADGSVWLGGSGLSRLDGDTWKAVSEPKELVSSWINAVYTDPEVGTNAVSLVDGAFYYDGDTWTRHDIHNGLAGNVVHRILQTDDKSVWVLTARGMSRFDGQAWVLHNFLSNLGESAARSREEFLLQSRDGALWVNSIFGPWVQRGKRDAPGDLLDYDLKTVCYRPDRLPPETVLTVQLDEVSQPGNTTVSWSGADPWNQTEDRSLQYAWRLDGGMWSSFSSNTTTTLLALPAGLHTFEVKARDLDFNEDPTAASFRFTVVPPVWRQPWFVGTVVVLLLGIGVQTGRVILRDRRLFTANTKLEAQNRQLEAARETAD
ncbi:MAG: hypothetical protein O2954_16195, partial [bacterium]|nr:hypothetical protein [bacterium]